MKVAIVLKGCDDDTRFNMEVTETEFNFLEELVHKSKINSNCGCMPVMYIIKLNDTKEFLG